MGISLRSYFDELGFGILQGDTLAPYLFVILIDWVMQNELSWLLYQSLGGHSNPLLYMSLAWTLLTILPSYPPPCKLWSCRLNSGLY